MSILLIRRRLLMKRRSLLLGLGAVATVGLVGRYGKALTSAPGYQPLLDLGEDVSKHVQRLILHDRPLAREFRPDQITPNHPSNGGFGSSYVDQDPAYDAMVLNRFRDWRLRVSGLVRSPGSFSLDDIRAMPQRTQITMHNCDEGWSAIGQWTGVPLGWLLGRLEVLPSARHVVFYCLDKMGGQQMFDSLDLIDALHPQTILAHGMNGADLPVRYGAPLRLRVELQIGYKNVKHLEHIAVVDRLDNIFNGRGGLFQADGYQRYAGM